ncbi:XP_036355409.1uncharacterized protein LOC115230134 [Octopus vulgaris]|uniref:XP_036355409.1uncharacterized protein LOC115230134 n=1 Tax=Octopus vulgaris TaxID=6645 RepID=A0AA36FMY2_OCTVU|nr:XP_036355409.1uncharacterized protein LOC115230134 [Octopus vulgaris]
MFSSGSNGPKKRNVSNGETVIFKQCFYSHPKSDVKWQKNEESIDSNKYLITDYLQDEFPFKGSCTSLKIEDIKDDAIGTYTLTVENSIGKETVVFTLRYKKKQEIPMEIIIGCTVGIVLLLIIMGLLTYIFYKRRANEEQYAEASGPSYLELKPAGTDGTYVNASNKPAGSTESILSNDVTQLISRKDEILKRLPEHFKSVSNQESTRNAEELVEHPSLQETSTVIEKLSNGKDLGQDDIPIEVCKHGSRQIVNKLCKLICLIWETGSVPQQFKDACIMHLYKNKRKRSQCDNPLFQYKNKDNQKKGEM